MIDYDFAESQPWISIIDMSNTIGTGKILVVKRVLLITLEKKGKAIALEDAECVGIAFNNVWNGETVKSALDKIFSKVGIPTGILKDGGPDLQKGVRIFCEENKLKYIGVIDDIGHCAANSLKTEFAKDPEFIKFLEVISLGSSKIRQSLVVWALPPKLRTKGRFQGITKIADWAKDMLFILDGHENKISKAEMEVLSKAFSGLIKLRLFLEKFITFCEIIEQFLKIMKNKGLNKKTATQSQIILQKLPSSKVKKRLLDWLNKHKELKLKMGIGNITLLVSSDIIESLFGKFKSITERSPNAELNKLIFIIPLLCGKITHDVISKSFLKCSHVEMQKYIVLNIPTTIKQQRLKLLKKSKNRVPNLRNYTSEKVT